MRLSPAGWYYFQAGCLRSWSQEWRQRAREALAKGHCDIARFCVFQARERLHDSFKMVRRARATEAI